VKQLKNLTIDFKKLNVFLKEKEITIDKLNFTSSSKDIEDILEFLSLNTSLKDFIENHKNILNASNIYCHFCDIIYNKYKVNEKFFKDFKNLDDFIKKIKSYSPLAAKERIKKDFISENLNEKQLKNSFNILSKNEELFSEIIVRMISDEIKINPFVNFDKKYQEINLLSKVLKIENFYLIFDKLVDKSKDSMAFRENRILLLNHMDKIFKDLNEKIENKKINVSDNFENIEELDKNITLFGSNYFDYLKKNYNSSKRGDYGMPIENPLTFNDINNIQKRYPNFYKYYLMYDPNLKLVELNFEKNKILEDRILYQDSKESGFKYLKSIFIGLKFKNIPQEEIFEIIKKDYFEIFRFLFLSQNFSKYLMLYEPKIKYLEYINSNYLEFDANEIILAAFGDDRVELLNKYFNFIKKQKIKIKFILDNYPKTLELINDINQSSLTFSDIFYKEIQEEGIMDDIKKYKNIYISIILNNKKLKVNEHFNLIKEDEELYKLFLNDFYKILFFLKNHEKEIPFSVKEIEDNLKSAEQGIVYLYFYRKKLNKNIEKMIERTKKTNEFYQKFLNSKINFKDYHNFDVFYKKTINNIFDFDLEEEDLGDFIPDDELELD
jgi:hypothetical protein